MILNQVALPFLLVSTILLAIGGGCAAPAEIPPASEEGEIQWVAEGEMRRVVEVKTEELTLHYRQQSFRGEKEFATHSANQAQFKSNFITDFEEGLALSDRPVSASDYSVSFDSTNSSITIQCDIHGAISKTNNRYRATFFWLLRPLGLDFIDDNFEGSEKGLFWQGPVKGVLTTINIKLPTIDSLTYKAWEHGVGHCHAHAWWGEP